MDYFSHIKQKVKKQMLNNASISDDRYKMLFLASRDAIMTLEPPSWRFTSANPATVEMFKARNEKDFLTYKPWKLSPARQPDGQPSSIKAKKMIKKAMRDGSNMFEWTHRRVNGEDFPAEVLLSRVKIGERTFLNAVVRDISVRRQNEAKLNEYAEEKFKAIFESSLDGMLAVDQETKKFTLANPAICHMLGYTEKELLLLSVPDIHPRESLPYVLEQFSLQLKGKIAIAADLPVKRKDGSIFYVDVSASPVILNNRPCLIGVFRDITQRKSIEQSLSSHVSLFDSIMNSIGDGLLVINLQGKVTYFNDQFRILWKIPKKIIETKDDNQLLKFVLGQLTDPNDFLAKVKHLYKHPTEKTDDDVFFKDGRVFRRISIPHFFGGKIVGRVWNFRDLTHQRQAEQGVIESEARLQNIFNFSSVAIFLVGLDGSFIKVNRQAERLWGYSEKELKQLSFADITHPDEAERDINKIKQMAAGKLDVYRVDKRYIRKDGTVIWARLNANLIRDKQGQPLYFLSVAEDITDRKEAQEALERSENKYRRLFEAAKDGILILDIKTGMITEVNPYLMDLLGYSHKHFLHKKIWEIGLFRDVISSRDAFEELKAQKYIHYEDLPLKTKNGGTIEVEFVSNVYGINGDSVVQCNIRDISERKRTEKFRLQTEMQYRDFMEKSNDGIVIIKGGLIRFANQAMEKMTGFKVSDILNQPMINFIAPDFKRLVAMKYRQRMAGIPSDARYEFSIVTNDDRIIPVETTSSIINFESGLADMAIIRDVSRSKEIDRIKSEFIAVASHQLRTPLTGVKWFSQLLLNDKSIKLSSTQEDYLKSIFDSNERMIKLVNDLLDVSHIETGRKFSVVKKKTDLITVIKRVIGDRTIAAKAGHISIELAAGAPTRLIVPIDEKKIEQALMNLVGNSIKYSGKGKKIIVGASKIGQDVYVSVKDSGLGIPKHQQKRIFEKFFRADNIATISQEGTGLGLYIVKSIVEGHGGKIKFESKENKGTTFYFTLPLK